MAHCQRAGLQAQLLPFLGTDRGGKAERFRVDGVVVELDLAAFISAPAPDPFGRIHAAGCQLGGQQLTGRRKDLADAPLREAFLLIGNMGMDDAGAHAAVFGAQQRQGTLIAQVHMDRIVGILCQDLFQRPVVGSDAGALPGNSVDPAAQRFDLRLQNAGFMIVHDGKIELDVPDPAAIIQQIPVNAATVQVHAYFQNSHSCLPWLTISSKT